MNITELVKSINTPYYETVASRLPRGIKSQQHLLNLGYVITVQDLGLSRAKTLDESFAANLVNSYHKQCLNEGVGSFLGKAAGHVVGGLGAAWRDAKKGYADAKASWADKTAPAAGAAPAPGGTAPAASGAAPAAGGTTAAPAPASGGTEPAAPPSTYATGGDTGRPYVAQPGAGAAPEAPAAGGSAPAPTAPASGGTAPAGDIGSIMKAIDGLDPASKKQLAGELEKSINTPAPAAEKPGAAPAAEKPGAAPAAGGTAPAAGAPTASTSAPAPADAAAPATPPAGGTTPPAGGKLTQAQQDAMKAKLQGQRQAGKTTATQTGSGFKDYVGGSQEKMAGVDASGAPVFKKLQRESVAFSKFLGVHI